MAQSGVIVQRKAGTMIPNDYFEKVIKENPTAFGAVVVTEKDGKKLMQISTDTKPMSLEDFQTAQKAFMDNDITFYFCNSESAVSLKDLSPHILIVKECEDNPEEEEPQVVAFIEGNFPTHVQAGSSHPPEYHLARDYLVPKLEGMFEMCDGDLDKVVEQLKKPFFKKELMLNSVSRGYITLVTATGACLTFAQGDTAGEFPWGWTSNTYGFGKVAEKPPASEKKPSIFAGKSTVREKATPPSEKIAEAVKAPATETASVKGYTFKLERPGAHLSRNETADWYKSRIGYKPPKSEERIPVNCYYDPQGKLLTFAQLNKQLGMAAAGLIAQAKNPSREAPKNTQPSEVKSEQTLPATSEKPVSVDPLPIMSPTTREKIEAIRSRPGYKQLIDENAKVIADPKQAESYEVKLVDFGKQMGVKDLREFGCWDYKMIDELPEQGAKVMLNSFIALAMKHSNVLFPPVAEKVEEKVEETPHAKKPSIFKRSAA